MLLGTYSVKQCCPSNNCLHFTIRYTSNFHATVHIIYIYIVMPGFNASSSASTSANACASTKPHLSHMMWLYVLLYIPNKFSTCSLYCEWEFFLSFYVHFVLRIIVVVAILFFILISHLLFQHILSFYVCVWGFTHFCNWFNFIKSILKCNHMKNSGTKIPTTATNKWQEKKHDRIIAIIK